MPKLSRTTILLENLNRLIEQHAELHQLIGVETEVRRIFKSIKHVLQKLGFSESIEDVIRMAEEFVETYARKVSESVTASIHKKPAFWNQLWHVRKDHLARIRNRLKDIRKQLPGSDNQDQQGSEDLQGEEDSQGEEVSSESLEQYYLMKCIFHLFIFPGEYEIPKRRLIALWVAEGLIGPKRSKRESDEQVAERHLRQLIEGNVVQVTKSKPNGEVQACKLSDLFRDLWSSSPREGNFTGNRRLVDHNGIHTNGVASFITIHGNPRISESVPKYGDVISFLSFDTKEEDNPGEDIGQFLGRCISAGCFAWLKVLDLERVFRPNLPKTLGKLINLKYLGLRWTYLQNLPSFVNKLLSLQVLDVKHTYFSYLPKSIWSMQYLRHLYLNEGRTRFPARPSGAVSLTSLHTLWGASIDENTCVTKGLDASKKIRKLGLSCRRSRSTPQNTHMMLKQLQAINNWISKLRSLESLRLKSQDEQGKPSDLHLISLQGNQNLSTLYLFGRLRQSVVFEFPLNLTEITLTGSELTMDPMKFLGGLQKLQYLRLLGHSVVSNRMHCSSGDFPKLELLHIWKLEDLEKWEVEKGSLPSLEQLEIRSCHQLKMLPDGLQHVTTLKKLRLTYMPETFINQTKDTQPQLSAKIEVAPEVGQEQS